MEYQLSEIDEDAIQEPVTLEEVKAYCMIDQDYASDDNTLEMLISTARVRLEQYLNIGFAKRDVKVQWNGNVLDLPLSPTGDIVTLKDKDNEDVPTDKYTISAYTAKKIFIHSIYNGDVEWFYSIISGNATPWRYDTSACLTDIYTIIYSTGYENLPKALKQALLAEIDFLFKLRGLPVITLVSPNAALLASGYSRNLVL